MKTIIMLICLLVPFPRVRRRLRTWLKVHMGPYINTYSYFLLRMYTLGHDCVLWFDHSFGGGTETYSFRQFKELRSKKRRVIRIQYFPAYKYFLLSTPTRGIKITCTSGDLDILRKMNITDIVVNNLVGYGDISAIFDLISDIKRNAKNHIRVSFRGHDFHSICPSYNLINCDGRFCGLNYRYGCAKCWAAKKNSDIEYEQIVFRGTAVAGIDNWRKMWGDFFAETLDEMIVFSDAIKSMFIKIYPQLENKIIVIPHFVPRLRRVNVPEHNDINIACLGNISQPKGRDVIVEMCKINKKNVNLFVIGHIDNAPNNLTVTGQYRVQNLPALVEKYKIDLIFIPSIWPETFSYTASEAMSMGIPVACYNMGAPAERVGKYEHGLVLSEINPQKNIREIVAFIKRKREES